MNISRSSAVTVFDAIESVTPLDVAKLFNMDIKRNRARCPFHDGQDRNLGFVAGKKWCHCFVCSRSFNALTLYKQLSGIGNSIDAARAMAADFGIRCDDVDDATARRYAEERRRMREQLQRDAAEGRRVYSEMIDMYRQEEERCAAFLSGHRFDTDDDRYVDVAETMAQRLAVAQQRLDVLLGTAPETDAEYAEMYRETMRKGVSG